MLTEFKKLYTRAILATYINFNQVERLKMLAKVNVETDKIPQTEEDDGSSMMDDDY